MISIITLNITWQGEELTSHLAKTELVVEGVLIDLSFKAMPYDSSIRLLGPHESHGYEDHPAIRLHPSAPPASASAKKHMYWELYPDVHTPREHELHILTRTCLILQQRKHPALRHDPELTSAERPYSIGFRFLAVEEVLPDAAQSELKRYRRTGAGYWTQDMVDPAADMSEFNTMVNQKPVKLELV
jgi:hypothetical protein